MYQSVWGAAARRVWLPSALLICSFSSAVAQSVPAPWAARDIGNPALSGNADHSGGVFTVEAAGEDISGEADQFHFVYQQIAGDVGIVAMVDHLTVTDDWAKAGVMIRGSLDAGAAHGSAIVSGVYGVRFQRRPLDGGPSTSTWGSANGAPVWLRAVRSGARVTTAWSGNGTDWTTIGSDTVALGTSAYVGIAVTSHNPGARTTAGISPVQVRGQGGTSVQQGLPQFLQNRDIGEPDVRGAAVFSAASGSYTITAAGWDIWDRSDQFHFVYQAVSGNVDVVARVASLGATDDWAKAGVMVRESLAPDSRHVMMSATADSGYAFQRRAEPGAESLHASGGAGGAPGWVRLVRNGNLFEAYRSANGSTWTRMGADSVPMGDTVYVGLAVTSHNPFSPTTAAIDNFQVSAGTAAAPAPAPPASTSAPRLVVFGASADHATNVTGYLFEVFAAGADPWTATPLAASNLGKPSPAWNNEITVDRAAFFSALAGGDYVATVTAVGPNGRTRSGSVSFER